MQDVLLLNGDYRMNTPGREIANWTVKFTNRSFNQKAETFLAELTEKYNRYN